MIARRALALFAPAAVAVTALSPFAPAALLLFLPLAIGALALVPLWRRHLYALDNGAIYIKEGLLRPRLWIVPFGKAQTIGIRRSLLQRKLGLATVEIDTAGASVLRYPAIRDLEQGEADRLADRLLEEYRTARAGALRTMI
jgi:putative membrane protein